MERISTDKGEIILKKRNPNVINLADLAFGDSHKGSATDAIVRHEEASAVVRYNGGCQAGHEVMTSDGKQHIFAQFGSGMLVPGVKTHLSRFMLIDPLAMMREEKYLREVGVDDAFDRTTIDEDAIIVTPFHRAANRIREIVRGKNRHGSCGRGVGEAYADSLSDSKNMVLRAKDLTGNSYKISRKLAFIQGAKYAQVADIIEDCPEKAKIAKEIRTFTSVDAREIASRYRYFERIAKIVDAGYLTSLLQEGTVVFEGAQGVLLDPCLSFPPHTTCGNTTFANATTLLKENSYQGKITNIGLIRGYCTRHGPGPFPTEFSLISTMLNHEHNTTNEWQGPFRIGWLDIVLLKYSIEVCGGIDCLSVSHLDQLSSLSEWKAASSYVIRSGKYFREMAGFKSEDFFDCSMHGLAQRIKLAPNSGEQTKRQEFLTKLFMDNYLSPQYDRFTDMATYLHYIEKNLGAPIAITSYGPTAKDKKFLPVWEKMTK